MASLLYFAARGASPSSPSASSPTILLLLIARCAFAPVARRRFKLLLRRGARRGCCASATREFDNKAAAGYACSPSIGRMLCWRTAPLAATTRRTGWNDLDLRPSSVFLTSCAAMSTENVAPCAPDMVKAVEKITISPPNRARRPPLRLRPRKPAPLSRLPGVVERRPAGTFLATVLVWRSTVPGCAGAPDLSDRRLNPPVLIICSRVSCCSWSSNRTTGLRHLASSPAGCSSSCPVDYALVARHHTLSDRGQVAQAVGVIALIAIQASSWGSIRHARPGRASAGSPSSRPRVRPPPRPRNVLAALRCAPRARLRRQARRHRRWPLTRSHFAALEIFFDHYVGPDGARDDPGVAPFGERSRRPAATSIAAEVRPGAPLQDSVTPELAAGRRRSSGKIYPGMVHAFINLTRMADDAHDEADLRRGGRGVRGRPRSRGDAASVARAFGDGDESGHHRAHELRRERGGASASRPSGNAREVRPRRCPADRLRRTRAGAWPGAGAALYGDRGAGGDPLFPTAAAMWSVPRAGEAPG